MLYTRKNYMLSYDTTGGSAVQGTTAPYGSIDRPFDACHLAEAAGATYVARSTAYHVQHLVTMITGGIKNHGFSFIEAMVQCPTAYGRKNKMADPAKMLEWMKDTAQMKNVWDKNPTDEKFPIGVLYQSTAGEIDYSSAYEKVIEMAGGI